MSEPTTYENLLGFEQRIVSDAINESAGAADRAEAFEVALNRGHRRRLRIVMVCGFVIAVILAVLNWQLS